MSRLKTPLLVLLAVVTWGSLLTTGGYAWYWRSDAYRQRCAAYLSELLQLPTQIARVVPRARLAQEFGGVEVWLPERRARVLICDRAVVRYRPDELGAYDLELYGGMAEVSSRTWLRSDYRQVVETGLRLGLADYGPRRATFSRMTLRCEAAGLTLTLDNAGGTVHFHDDDTGRLAATCNRLNGYQAREPVVLGAEFSSLANGVRIDDLLLTVPHLELADLELGQAFDAAPTSGAFAGRLRYQETAAGPTLTLQGRCTGLRLAEFTGPWLGRALAGQCPEVRLDEWRIEQGRTTRLSFGGLVDDLPLGDVLALSGIDADGGLLTLRVRSATLTPTGIEHLSASGGCTEVDLDALSASLGYGRLTGRLRITIDELTIERNRLARLQADLRVIGDPDPPNWIEGRLLREIVQAALGFELPLDLPQRVPYRRLGVRLDVRDEQLFLLGSHGPHDRTILTVELAGVATPLIQQPAAPLDLRPRLDDVRRRAAAQLERRLERGAATSRPAQE